MHRLRKYIGDKSFYKMVIMLVVPLIIQQGVTNFVSLLDNLMVGSLGTASVSGVAIANQLIFVFNLTLFGGLSGASIFGAQFYGKRDHDGLRQTFRFKMIFGIAVTIIAIAVFVTCGDSLVMLFLQSEQNDASAITETLALAKDYFSYALWGLAPFMVVQVYSGTLRETGETVAPMIGSIIAIVVNLTLNYLLIFGSLGFPKMGVAGAALATAISRYIEMGYILIYTHRSSERFEFIRGAYRSLHISGELIRRITITGFPLLLNETLWSIGQTFINQSYSTRGLTVVAATNITSTAWNLFCVIMFAMGNAVAILVGQKLGAGDVEGAKDYNRKLIAFNLVMHIGIGVIIIACSGAIPLLYNVEPAVRELSTQFLVIAGCMLPIQATVHASYFAIRSGGKTVVTFLFDCAYTWVVPAMLALVLCRFTALPVVLVYLIVQGSDAIKLGIAIPLLKSGFWAKNVVTMKKSKA